ncbi:hypothetical protein Tco_1459298 [Tanacetum coccineum]
MSKQRFASKVDVNNNLSKSATQHYLPKRRESTFAKPDHMIASSSSRNSFKNMPRFSSNDMIFTGHRFSSNKTSVVYEKTSPKSDLRLTVNPPHGSNVDIPNIHECKQTLDVSVGTSINVQKEQSLDINAELESLFGSSFDEYFNGENQVVSKSSAVTTADASDKRQQQPDSTSSTSTLATTVSADGNFDFFGITKSYVDKRRKPLEFSVGDYVLLKVSPWKGVVRFGKRGKLAPRFVGPFKIVEKVGPVAYRLDLPEELNGVHDTFHVSNLKKCLADPTLQVPLDEIRVDAKLNFVEEPVEILEREFKKLKRSRIAIVKVRWNSKRGPEFTWEREDQMKLKYPLLFSDVSG